MAAARIIREWADGSSVVVEVEADGQHPDLLDQLVRRVIHLDREAAPEVEGE